MSINTPSIDKIVEKERFNQEARQLLAFGVAAELDLDGARSISEELRAPYLLYEKIIGVSSFCEAQVLDLCCGTGTHTLTAAHLGAHVTAADIAENNLAAVSLRARRAGVQITTVIADAEMLPLPTHSFDLVTCAGGLSYVHLPQFLDEVKRVLKPGGTFLCVDSFNHNPIYRLNRYLHYLRGNRSHSTLQRMPNRQTLALMRAMFPDLEIRYFGIGSFLMPLIRSIVGSKKSAHFSDWLDETLPFMKEWAFKIVAYGHVYGTPTT